MKWIGALFGILLTIAVSLYVLLFTPPGNGIVAPIVEGKINAAIPLETKLEKFELTSSSFAITLLLSEHNRIEAVGNYSLFGQSLNAAYRLRADELSELEPLTQTPLSGTLHTEGEVTGTLEKLNINGTSDLAGSDTEYTVVLTKLDPTSIQAKITDAELTTLLQMVGEKPYSSAKLSLKANLKSIKPKALDGNILLSMTQGRIDRSVMKKDFNLTLPETTYTLNALAYLKGEQIEYESKLDSNLAYLFSQGKVTPEPLATDLLYEVNIKELALFKPLTNAPLRGPFSTSGTLKGDEKQMNILGKSDIATSKTTYDISLEAFKPQRILANIVNADLAKLLYLSGQPRYATGNLNVDLTLKSLDFDNLKGHADVKVTQGKLVSKTFKQAYGITLPKTSFTYDLGAELKGSQVDYSTVFTSNLAKLDSKGNLTPKTLGMDLDYTLNIQKLELLKPLTGMPLRGVLNLSGTVRGDEKVLSLEGKSNLAKSRTTFSAQLVEFAPQSLKADIKGLQLASALYMVEQPHYADAVVDIKANISDARAEHLKGTITSTFSQGIINSNVMAKEFELTSMPHTTFSGTTATTLTGNFINTKANITSSPVNLSIKQARYDLDKALLTSDYTAEISDLDKLFFVTKRHLKGALTLTGELKKGSDLDLTAHAKTLGGTLSANVHNDDVHADFNGIQTLDTLKMLIYPQIFKSSLDGTLDYNLAKESGIFNATLSEGKFTNNNMLNLLKDLAHVDLYRETFTTTLQSRINKEQINSDLDMRSRKSSISANNIMLNTQTQQINANLKVVANNNPIGVKLRGNVNKPNVKLDLKELLKKESTKALEKEAKKQLNKLLKGLF